MRGRRRAALLLAPPLGALLAVGVLVLHDRLRSPPPGYRPVVRPTALDAWPGPAAGEAPPACGGKPRRWMIFGWDGASWDVVVPLLEQGRLPSLAGLIREGAHGNLYSFEPTLSPALWTTVATGVSPERHGVRAFDRHRHERSYRILRRLRHHLGLAPMATELVSNADRRAPALWNLFSEAGRSVLVVGYHNTFPAERVRGVVVSNFAVHAYMGKVAGAADPLGGEFVRSLVFPPERTAEVLAEENEVEAGLREAIASLAELSEEDLDRVLAGDGAPPPGTAAERLRQLRRAYRMDAFHARVAMRYYADLVPDLLLLHFQAVDLASHYFLYFHEPERYARMAWPSEARARLERDSRRFRSTVASTYELLDRWLGWFLARRPPDAAVMVLSDHGFEPDDDLARVGGHERAPPGILVLAGPGIERGRRLEGATLYDVLPTVLLASELALSRELEGRPLEEAFCPETRRALVRREVDRYAGAAPYAPDIAYPSALEEEVLEDLRALGYVQ
jgi:hypothetical protein